MRQSSMCELSRYYSFGIVSLHLVLAVVVVNLGTVLLAGSAPSWLFPAQQWIPFNIRDELGQQIAGAQKQGKSNDGAVGPQVVVLGYSTAREALDPSVFGIQVNGIPSCWNFGTKGWGFQQLKEQVDLYRLADVDTDVIILAVHPTCLVGRRFLYDPVGLGDVWTATLRMKPLEIKHYLARYFWLYSQREAIHRWIEKRLDQANERLYEGNGIQFLFSADPNPFRSRVIYDVTASRRPESALAEQQKYWEKQGWFDPDRYLHCDDQIDYFDSAVDLACQRCRIVYLVLMPERSDLRLRLPAIADEKLRAAVGKYLDDPSVQVIDMREDLDDSMFLDYIHVNARGREAFSAMIEQELRPLLNNSRETTSKGSAATR